MTGKEVLRDKADSIEPEERSEFDSQRIFVQAERDANGRNSRDE